MHYLGGNSFTLDELYMLCARFIKEKEGKAFHLSYQDRLQLAVHCKQVAHGPYKSDASPGVGWLDVVGGDRKAAWQALGDLSRERAQEKFVEILDRACPLLAPYLEAHLNEKRDREKKLKEEAEAKEQEAQRLKQQEMELQRQKQLQQEQQERQLAEAAAARQEVAKQIKSTAATGSPATSESRRHQQEAQIRAALNQQTAVQFRQYAAEQHPQDAGKQAELIAQLQEQHFQQYMSQVYQRQLRSQEEEQARQLQQKQQQQNSAVVNNSTPMESKASAEAVAPEVLSASQPVPAKPITNGDATSKTPPPLLQPPTETPTQTTNSSGTLMAAPSMWCDKQLTAAEFKAKLAADSDARLKIGPGEVVTVRVPTHEEGSCIVWEFATDHYDIGFGVYFEWTISPSDRVTVHISESSDEDEEDEPVANDDGNEAGEAENKQDQQQASKRRRQDDDKAIDEIIPVFRRDCHSEVYCGSHQYPGRGVYLLKFDNSYSLWRSKWLYYRVYYTK